MVQEYYDRADNKMLSHFVELMADPRYHQHIDFEVVIKYIPKWKDLTLKRLHSVVMNHKKHKHDLASPYLEDVINVLIKKDTNDLDLESDEVHQILSDLKYTRDRRSRARTMSYFGNNIMHPDQEIKAQELRKTFIELLHHAYDDLIAKGEINSRDGMTTFILLQSLDIARDEVNLGKPLNDWDAVLRSSYLTNKLQAPFLSFWSRNKCCQKNTDTTTEMSLHSTDDVKKVQMVRTAMALIEAHRIALEHFSEEFAQKEDEFNTPEHVVVTESKQSAALAKKAMNEMIEKKEFKMIVSKLLCQALYSGAARQIEHLHEVGLISEQEAAPYINEVQKCLIKIG